MVDWHCHLLPGIDDGPATEEESLEVARGLSAAGFTAVHCTPHLIRGSFEAPSRVVRGLVESLQERLREEGIPLVLHPGREYSLDEFLPGFLADPLPLGDSRFILIEIPAPTPPEVVKQTLYGVVCSGYTPVIAHPERCPLLAIPDERERHHGMITSILGRLLGERDIERERRESPLGNPLLEYLIEIGCRFQGNLGSFHGWYGGRVRKAAERFRTKGLYDFLGTDLHSVTQLRHWGVPLGDEFWAACGSGS